MRESVSWFVVFVTLLALVQVVGAQQQGQFILAVSDSQGAPAASFTPADLQVYEDGKPAKVAKVEPRQSSLKVVLALDNGRMMGDILVHVRAAAIDFVNTLPSTVEVALMTTAPVPRVAVKSTMDREQLLKGINAIGPDSSSGRAIEAFEDVARAWKKNKTQGDLVLVLLASTFGPEMVKEVDVKDAVAELRSMRAVMHTVLLSPTAATEGEAQRMLTQKVSNETRGRFEQIGSYLQLNVLNSIARSLAASAGGGQFVITLDRPEGATGKLGSLSVSASDGFLAGKITRMQ